MMTKSSILFFLLESVIGFLFGFLGVYFVSDFNSDSGFTWGIPLLLVVFIPSSIIGIAFPGYFQCKHYNDLKSYRAAILSSLVWLVASLVFLMLISLAIPIPNPLLIGVAIIISVVGFNLRIQQLEKPVLTPSISTLPKVAKTNREMNYRIKIIDLKNCPGTDDVYDCFAEALNFSSAIDKSSEELKKHISKVDNQLFSNVIIHNYGSAQYLGGNYFHTFLLHLFEFNKTNFEKIRIDTDYISESIFSGKLTIGKLFFDEPNQYGLRGDIGLWEDLGKYFLLHDLPQNENLLPGLIDAAITTLTGSSVFNGKNFHVDKYNQGGMSGGGISCAFWTRKAIPLIMSRMQSRPDKGL
jgi:hypothetical protein